jgi:hypothetical protein
MYTGDVDVGYAITVFECRDDVFYTILIRFGPQGQTHYADGKGWPDVQ